MTAIIRIDPVLQEIEKMFGEVWSPWEPKPGSGMPLDIHETKDELVITADLPGVGKDDVHITLEEETLKLEVEKKEGKAEGVTWYAKERTFGKFSRVLGLPFRIAGEKITATMENGVLEIRLPRAEEAKPKRIDIKPR